MIHRKDAKILNLDGLCHFGVHPAKDSNTNDPKKVQKRDRKTARLETMKPLSIAVSNCSK
eukprot:5615386-Amphidinium_carterae.1